MAVRLTWRGAQVEERVRRASQDAITERVEAAAQDARSSHWWQSRSGNLEGNIIAEPARLDAVGQPSGRFGTGLRREAFYGLFLERRTPFLRPAADRQFPLLAFSIRARLSRADRILRRFL